MRRKPKAYTAREARRRRQPRRRSTERISTSAERAILETRGVPQPDVALKAYFSNPARFADFVNAVLWDGVQLVRPENLREGNTVISALVRQGARTKARQRTKDVAYIWNYGPEHRPMQLLFAMENQTGLDDSMPERVIEGDVLYYLSQMSVLGKTGEWHKRKQALEQDANEFVAPVITIVVYYGGVEWTAPRSVEEQFDPAWPRFIRDACTTGTKPMHVFVAGRDDAKFLNRDNRALFAAIRATFALRGKELRKTLETLLKDSPVAMQVYGALFGKSALRERLKKGDGNMLNVIEEFEKELAQKDVQLEQKDVQLEQKDVQLGQKDKQLEQKDEQLKQMDAQLEQKDEQIGQMDAQLEQKDEQLEQKDEQIVQKNEQIGQQHDLIKKLVAAMRQGGASLDEIASHVGVPIDVLSSAQ